MVLFLLIACSAPPPDRVCVAAVQFHSIMGEVERNRRGLAELVHQAADGGAHIVVLPEAAISGYADIDRDRFWSASGDEPAASSVAEPADGESVRFFSRIAKDRNIYLTVPFVERAGGRYYNTVVLLGPDGSPRIHYRKQHLWTVADPSWATPGEFGTPVIDTEFGRIGVMVCYDVNYLLPEFKEKSADIVLHCVAWYGPWFDGKFNRRIKQAGVTLVLANWTFPEPREWRGAGASRIIGSDGSVLAQIERDYGNGVVFATLPVNNRPRP